MCSSETYTYFFYLKMYYESITCQPIALFQEFKYAFIDHDERTAFFWTLSLIEEKHHICTDFGNITDLTLLDSNIVDLLLDYTQFYRMPDILYEQKAIQRRLFLKSYRDNWFATSKFNIYGFVPLEEDYGKLF